MSRSSTATEWIPELIDCCAYAPCANGCIWRRIDYFAQYRTPVVVKPFPGRIEEDRIQTLACWRTRAGELWCMYLLHNMNTCSHIMGKCSDTSKSRVTFPARARTAPARSLCASTKPRQAARPATFAPVPQHTRHRETLAAPQYQPQLA